MGSVMQCATCAVEYDAAALPAVCPICADERQYLAPDRVQRWIDPADHDGRIEVAETEPGMWSVSVEDGPGINQQAQVIVTEHGNVMVEVPAAITASALDAVRALGPLRAVIASHPHMYGLQSVWARELGAEVYLSAADRHWVGQEPERSRLWDDAVQLVPGVVASQPGGHFPGSSVVHWTGADGQGVLLCGDTVSVNPDGATVAFMRSYPNRIPLSSAVVLRIADHLGRYDFDRLYDNFGRCISREASAVVRASAARHAGWASGAFDELTGRG